MPLYSQAGKAFTISPRAEKNFQIHTMPKDDGVRKRNKDCP